MSESVFEKHLKLARSKKDEIRKMVSSGNLGDVFEDGVYKMGLTNIESMTNKAGNPMVVFSFNFLDSAIHPEYIGKTKKIFRSISPENVTRGYASIMIMLNKLGNLELEDMEQIESGIEEVREMRPVCRITLTTKGEYQDGRLEKVLTGEESENMEEEVIDDGVVPAEEPAEDNVDVGSQVSFTWKGEELQGEIKEFTDGDTKAKVKVGTKLYPVKVEDLSLVKEEVVEDVKEDEVPEEPVEEVEDDKPVKKVVKKTGKDLKKKK